MKKIFTLIIIISSIQLYSQYNKFIDTNKVWQIKVTYIGTDSYISNLFFKGDTIIENKTYSKLFITDLFFIDEYPYSNKAIKITTLDSSNIRPYLYNLIREDTINKQVFYYSENKDILIYDFSLNIADTFNYFDNYCIDSYKMNDFILLDSIKTIMFENNFQSMVYFFNVYNTNYDFFDAIGYYIEGIGGEGFISSLNALCYPEDKILCVKKNDTIIYGTPFEYNVGINNLELLSNQIKFFPNPVSGSVTIESSIILKDIKIFNAFGIEVFNKSNINDYKLNINTSSFSDGIYFIKCTDSNNNISTEKFLVK